MRAAQSFYRMRTSRTPLETCFDAMLAFLLNVFVTIFLIIFAVELLASRASVVEPTEMSERSGERRVES